MTNADTPRPFHERFAIEVGTDEVKRRFVNRATNNIFRGLLLSKELREPYGPDITRLYIDVVNMLGEQFDHRYNLDAYIQGDFYRCLLTLETVYQNLSDERFKDRLSTEIHAVIQASEIDLGVGWHPPIFVRTGAQLLDRHLVNEPLHWLSEAKYESVREPFEKGLSHYLEATHRPDRLPDVITDMYEAVEALAKIVTDRDKDLSGNREVFIKSIKASDSYKQLLKDYISYANQYRHAPKQNRPKFPLSEPEVESFIYLTGLFIRLAIRRT